MGQVFSPMVESRRDTEGRIKVVVPQDDGVCEENNFTRVKGESSGKAINRNQGKVSVWGAEDLFCPFAHPQQEPATMEEDVGLQQPHQSNGTEKDTFQSLSQVNSDNREWIPKEDTVI